MYTQIPCNIFHDSLNRFFLGNDIKITVLVPHKKAIEIHLLWLAIYEQQKIYRTYIKVIWAILKMMSAEWAKRTVDSLWPIRDYDPQQIWIHRVQQAWLTVFIIFYNKVDLQELTPEIIILTLNSVMTSDLYPVQIILKSRRKRWCPKFYLLFFSQHKNYTGPTFSAPTNTSSWFYWS